MKAKNKQKRLGGRIKDYVAMVSQHKIGDGKRDARGYHRPGSNKK